jgi:hypothetical protein
MRDHAPLYLWCWNGKPTPGPSLLRKEGSKALISGPSPNREGSYLGFGRGTPRPYDLGFGFSLIAG